MKIITTRGVVIPTLVTDANGKPVRVEVTRSGRKTQVEAYDHTHHGHGTVLDVSDDIAKELFSKNAARPHDEVLDGPDETESKDALD
jgi:hypothetical protein